MMKQRQFFTTIEARGNSPQLRRLKENLKEMISHEYTLAAYVNLSEEVWISGRSAHARLYENIAVQHDLYAPSFPAPIGFVHTCYAATIVWYLTYFTAGTWKRIEPQKAVTCFHNCLLQAYTLTEINLWQR